MSKKHRKKRPRRDPEEYLDPIVTLGGTEYTVVHAELDRTTVVDVDAFDESNARIIISNREFTPYQSIYGIVKAALLVEFEDIGDERADILSKPIASLLVAAGIQPAADSCPTCQAVMDRLEDLGVIG